MTNTTAFEPTSVGVSEPGPNGVKIADAVAAALESLPAPNNHLVNGHAAPIPSDVRNGTVGEPKAAPAVEVGGVYGADRANETEAGQDESVFELEDVKATRIAPEDIDATFRGRCIG